MLDINEAEKTLTLLVSRILDRPIEMKFEKAKDSKNDNMVMAVSKDISSFLGLPMMDTLRMSSNSIDYTLLDKDDGNTFWLGVYYDYTRNDSHNTMDCFDAILYPDGSLKSLRLNRDVTLTPTDPQFKKMMTTKDMVIDFFALLDKAFIRDDSLLNIINTPYFYIDCKNPAGQTGLHFLAKNGVPETMEILIKHGADINSYNENDETPLCVAISSRSPERVKFLLDNGASFMVRRDGMTALDAIKIIRKNINQDNINAIEKTGLIESMIENHMLDANIQSTEQRCAAFGF